MNFIENFTSSGDSKDKKALRWEHVGVSREDQQGK